jgi:site-specific recombinase XerC
LERLRLSGATINLHLSAIRRLADESAESGWLSPELAIGIRRVKGVKRLGRKIGNWLTGNQAQELLNAVSPNALRGMRDGAMLGLLLGCGLRRSEVVGLRLDQLQLREGHWGNRHTRVLTSLLHAKVSQQDMAKSLLTPQAAR